MLTRATARKGFTLIELIVTVVILGILAALAVPTFNAILGRVRDNNVATSANGIARNLHALAGSDISATQTQPDWEEQFEEMEDAGDLPESVSVRIDDDNGSNGPDSLLLVATDHGAVIVELGSSSNAGDFESVGGSDVVRADDISGYDAATVDFADVTGAGAGGEEGGE